MNQIGVSPKAIAAAATAYVAPIVAGYLAKQLGVDVDASTAATFIGPLVLAGVTFLAAYVAKTGMIAVDPSFYPDAQTGPNPPARLAEVDAEPAPKSPAKRISKPAARTAAKRKKAS